MKVHHLLLICLLSWTLAGADDKELEPLSDAEADVIAQAEVAARAEREEG